MPIRGRRGSLPGDGEEAQVGAIVRILVVAAAIGLLLGGAVSVVLFVFADWWGAFADAVHDSGFPYWGKNRHP